MGVSLICGGSTRVSLICKTDKWEFKSDQRRINRSQSDLQNKQVGVSMVCNREEAGLVSDRQVGVNGL